MHFLVIFMKINMENYYHMQQMVLVLANGWKTNLKKHVFIQFPTLKIRFMPHHMGIAIKLQKNLYRNEVNKKLIGLTSCLDLGAYTTNTKNITINFLRN
ncbi:hypothetical protein SPV1_06384 [Mariprofundus ferrooxydans PV-1]|uniref:Uncharacterized protein n=1 Tax=Mariprofundus ferrooxydans PV-1 TaxID=314345 RepID=Q0EWP4_9PROT|nr:hypothetical protein SPV1_06384 [Mariprofundus ferrooxydans PV-1]